MMLGRTAKIMGLVAGTVFVLLVLMAGTVSAADPAKGKTLWAQFNCKSCHGDNGEGKYAGPRAGDGLTADGWIKQVRTPRANMPSFTAAQVSDADIADMNAYMQTLTKPASFTPTVFPTQTGDPQGKIIMAQKRCVACHGDGAGLVKARFTDQGRQVTTEAVIKQLRTPAQRMPSFSATQVTDADAAQIADYLKTLVQAAAQTPAAAPTPAQVPATPAPAQAPAATQTPAQAATAATLPKTGDPLPIQMLALFGLIFIGAGVTVRRLLGTRR